MGITIQMTFNHTITYLPWDSSFFGYKVGSIHLEENANTESLIEQSKQLDYKLVYIFLEPAAIKTHLSLIASECNLVDEKITYKKEISNISSASSPHITSYLHKPVSADLLKLALQSGAYSRFKIDSHFKQNEYERLYTHWLAESIKGVLANNVFIYQINDQAKGLITLMYKDNYIDIGLLSVDEQERGKAIGTQLVQQAVTEAVKQGKDYVQVITQKQNLVACSFYEKQGFYSTGVVNIYHLWND